MTTHKAEEYGYGDRCKWCNEPTKIVPGGHGPTRVHATTGTVAGRVDPDSLINAMLDTADDWEADILDALLVRSGYWWRCEDEDAGEFCGFVRMGDACDLCGRRQIHELPEEED